MVRRPILPLLLALGCAGPDDEGTTDSGPPTVLVNEILAGNDAAVPDPAGEYDDWVELYNASGAEVDLEGWTLQDDGLLAWTFPSGTTIAAGGFAVVWCDEDTDQEGLHASFRIARDGDSVRLADPSGTEADAVTFGAQAGDTSWGRDPDGSETWRFFPTPTPGASNG